MLVELNVMEQRYHAVTVVQIDQFEEWIQAESQPSSNDLRRGPGDLATT